MRFCQKHPDRPVLARGLCQSCYHLDWERRNKERRKLTGSRTKEARQTWFRKSKYGLTKIDYEDLLKTQNGLCALCSRKPKRLVVDHCHKTQRVRGLLCDQCNIALGFYEQRLEKNPLVSGYLGRKV